MDTKENWDLLLNMHPYACFLADAKTREIFHVNDKFKEIAGLQESVIGQSFTELQLAKKHSISNTDLLEWDMKTPLVREHFSKSQNVTFICTFFLIPQTEIVCSTTKVVTQGDSVYNFETALSECVDLLHLDVKERSEKVLEILGHYYSSDKACFYCMDRNTGDVPCIHSWTRNDSITPTQNLSEIVNMKTMVERFKEKSGIGIVDISSEETNSAEEFVDVKLLEKFSLDNLVIGIIDTGDDETVWLLTISNRRHMKSDFRLIQSVKMLIEQDLTKSQVKLSAQQLNDKDILTGFSNRSAYSIKLDELAENPPKTLGVFLANVNGLKKINTEFGYAQGDIHIKKASETMREYFDEGFYRVAGDEFVAFFPDSNKEEFENKISSLQKDLKEKHEYHFAIGHAWESGHYNCGQMISEADTIMYINKQEYYHNSKVSHSEVTDNTLSDLLSYLEDEEFMVYLQPQVRLKDGSLYGAEALIRRFDKKNQRMVFPDQFISLYEQKSVIRHVDMFVIESVCKLITEWQKAGINLPISVNLSRVTLQEYGIVDTIVEICEKYKVPHHLLVIEVTERVGLIENNVASSLIQAFKDNGFNISLDDFGCAYSNIVTLAQIEVDEVKIDKSLVDDLTTNDKNHILVKNVLTMCNELEGASTLAEGIEDEDQARLLYELGCHLGQGYFYSRPIPIPEFKEKYIENMVSSI